MGARYLVDGYCLDEAVAFKLYVSKLQPTVINDALIFPELAGNQLSFSTVTVDLSAYLQRCDGDFYAAGAADFYSYYPVHQDDRHLLRPVSHQAFHRHSD